MSVFPCLMPVASWLRQAATLIMLFLLTVQGFCAPVQPAAAQQTTYYVDCVAGDDAQNGTSEQTAWNSLHPIDDLRLSPGDRLLLKRGCAWSGPLRLPWVATAERPIVVSAYGTGDLPIIERADSQVVILGSYLTVEYIETRSAIQRRDSGCENQPVGWAVGVSFEQGASYNTLRYSRASGMTRGVQVRQGAHHNHIVSNELVDNVMMGTLDSQHDNDSGAQGVELEGDDNEVAYNTISGHDACSYDYGRDGAAIEVYGGRNNSVHHNRAHNNNTFAELGLARSANNTFAYNLVTADIADVFFLITRGVESAFGPIVGTYAYNNTVYFSDHSSIGVTCDGFCQRETLALKNNIIWSEGIVGYIDHEADEGYNIFWRSDGKPEVFFPNREDVSTTSRLADPAFVAPQSGDFRLAPSSPAIDAGSDVVLEAGYTVALNDMPVPQGKAVDMGAYEFGNLSIRLLPSVVAR